MVLRVSQDLLEMPTSSLVSLLSDFTGLYTDDKIIRDMGQDGSCSTSNSEHLLHASDDEFSDQVT